MVCFPAVRSRTLVSLQARTVSRVNVTLCTLHLSHKGRTDSYRTRTAPATLPDCDSEHFVRFVMSHVCSIPDPARSAVSRSESVIPRLGGDDLVTSPRMIAPSPKISSPLPELPGEISVAPLARARF